MKEQELNVYKLTNTSISDGTKKCAHGVAEIEKDNEAAIKNFISCNEIANNDKLYRVNYKRQSKNVQNSILDYCPQFVVDIGNHQLKHFELCVEERLSFHIFCKSVIVSSFYTIFAVCLTVTLLLIIASIVCWKFRLEMKVSLRVFSCSTF